MQSGQELTMRTIREVLRLGFSDNLSLRDIGRSLRVTHPTVQKYLQAARDAGLDWPKIAAMDDDVLRKVICRKPERDPHKHLPDYAIVHQELKKPSVTIYLLWQEYKAAHPDGYQETQFRQYYHEFAKKLSLSMRLRHKFGDAMFVDYAGQTVRSMTALLARLPKRRYSWRSWGQAITPTPRQHTTKACLHGSAAM